MISLGTEHGRGSTSWLKTLILVFAVLLTGSWLWADNIPFLSLSLLSWFLAALSTLTIWVCSEWSLGRYFVWFCFVNCTVCHVLLGVLSLSSNTVFIINDQYLRSQRTSSRLVASLLQVTASFPKWCLSVKRMKFETRLSLKSGKV